jgi:SAM-dependent methyltransferase
VPEAQRQAVAPESDGEQMSEPTAQDESLRRMSQAERYNAWLLARAQPYLGARALDVGAGIGTFAVELARLCEFVAAVEPDPADRARLEQRFADDANVRVFGIGAESLGGAELGGPFDAAICFNVLEHIEDDLAALAAVRGQLRPNGGHLLLLVPAHRVLFGEIDHAVGHMRRYDRATLRARLERTGFGLRELRYVNPLGAIGWLVSSRLLRRQQVPEGPLELYDRLVPVLRTVDRIPLPFGLSVWAVAYTPARASARAAKA